MKNRQHLKRFQFWATTLTALVGASACGVEPGGDMGAGGKTLMAVDDCREGFGGCTQSLIVLGKGSSCTTNSECATGFCVDGVCCASSCSSSCQACSTAKKGSGSNGICGNIAPYTDPDNECASGDCNGSGACGVPPGTNANGTACTSGATCLSGYCADGVCCDNACSGTCTACTTAKKGSGANGVCGNIAAATDPDNDCVFGNCNGSGACGASILQGNGASCSNAGQCSSGFCVDGVCCNNACSGSCDACNVPGSVGACSGTCASACNAPPTIPLTGTILRSGDVNVDGNADLVSVGNAGIEVALGQGNGTFGPAIFSPSVSEGIAWDAVLGDLNGDGKVDLMYQRAGTGMGVQLNLGNGTFGPEVQYALPPHRNKLLLSDFDGDGQLDVVTSMFQNTVYTNPSYTSQTIYVVRWHGNGNGKFGPYSSTYLTSVVVSYQAERSVPIAGGDFDGNGTTDVILSDFEWHGTYMYKNPGNGQFGSPIGVNGSGGAYAQSGADMNGDGKAEYIFVTAGDLSIRFFDGSGAGGYFQVPLVNDLVTTDLNNDGLKDVAFVSTAENIVSVALQKSNGAFGPRADYVVGGSPSSLAAGDWDNDGKMDLAVHKEATGTVTILYNTCLP